MRNVGSDGIASPEMRISMVQRVRNALTWQPSWPTVRIVIAAMPLLLALIGMVTDFQSTRQQIAGRVAATTSLVATYVGSALDQAATSSFLLADFLARNNLRSRPQAIVETALLSRDLVRENQAVAAILVVGRDGEIVVDSRTEHAEWPPGEADGLLDRHRALTESDNPLVSPPFVGPATGERQFSVSVSVRTDNDIPDYVVASTIVAEELIARLRAASPYRDFTITLFDYGGNVLARHPSIGTNFAPIDVERVYGGALGPAGTNHIFVGRLTLSPRLRVIDVTALTGFPLGVSYSVAYWEAFGPWLQRSVVFAVTAIAAAALLYLAVGQLMAASRREIDAERSLREAIDRERKAEIVAIRNQDREIIARMAGGVGHEFNNLMAGVLGIGEALSNHPVAADQAGRFGRSLAQAAERGGTLAHALMIYAGRGFLDARLVDLGDVVASAVEAFRTTVGPRVEIGLPAPRAPLHARIDPDKLAIAISHLLTNAVDALPDRIGSIDVTVETGRALPAGAKQHGVSQTFATISVTDSGIGMTPEILARARDPFFTTRDVGLGAGLGLSMVDGFIQASGGHLEIESRPNQGTRVTMWLPLADAASEPAGEGVVSVRPV